jgi:hypothetical protein
MTPTSSFLVKGAILVISVPIFVDLEINDSIAKARRIIT